MTNLLENDVSNMEKGVFNDTFNNISVLSVNYTFSFDLTEGCLKLLFSVISNTL
jgi:hypothetical protein